MDQSELIQEASGRVMHHFMTLLDTNRAVLNEIIMSGIIEISDPLSPLSVNADSTNSLGIYVDVVVSKDDIEAQHEVVKEIIEHPPVILDLEGNRELSVNYFLVNPELYFPMGKGYDIQINDGAPIAIPSVDQAVLFEHGPISIDTLRSHKQDGVLSEATFNSIRESELLSFPALVMISL